MPFPAGNCKEQTPTALKRKVVGTLQSPLQGLRLPGAVRVMGGGCIQTHSHTHTPQWQMTYWTLELFCGCYTTNALGFHLAMWQTLTSARGRACGWVHTVKGLWGWVGAGRRRCPPRCCLRPQAFEHGLLNPALLLLRGNQFALYTTVRRAYKSQWLFPLSHLLQVCSMSNYCCARRKNVKQLLVVHLGRNLWHLVKFGFMFWK